MYCASRKAKHVINSISRHVLAIRDLLTSSSTINSESHILYVLNLGTERLIVTVCVCVFCFFFSLNKWTLFGSLWPPMSATIVSQMVSPAQVGELLTCTACIESVPCAFLPLYPPLNRADGGFMVGGDVSAATCICFCVCTIAQALPKLCQLAQLSLHLSICLFPTALYLIFDSSFPY